MQFTQAVEKLNSNRDTEEIIRGERHVRRNKYVCAKRVGMQFEYFQEKYILLLMYKIDTSHIKFVHQDLFFTPSKFANEIN